MTRKKRSLLQWQRGR